MSDPLVSGKLRATLPPFTEDDVCIRFLAENTYSGTIAIARLDGAPVGGDETSIYSLTDEQGNVCKWRWSGRFKGGFYLGHAVS